MATQKLQVNRALPVLPSNNCDVPFPAVTTSGTATANGGFNFSDSTKNFIALNVSAGDIVYNTTSSTGFTVISVVNATTLEINVSGGVVATNAYTIYLKENNNGCVIMVGAAGTVRLTTSGGDTVTLNGLAAGQFIPVQALKIWLTGTTATGIVAFW
jgi:nucleoside phosphorylase